MPLSISDAIPGALVEQYFVENEKKQIVVAPVRRRGYIVKVEYPDDQVYDNSMIRAIWVKFRTDAPPEIVKAALLNLVRKSDQASMTRLKRDKMNQEAEEIETKDPGRLDVQKSPVKDKTGVFIGERRMSPEEAKKL